MAILIAALVFLCGSFNMTSAGLCALCVYFIADGTQTCPPTPAPTPEPSVEPTGVPTGVPTAAPSSRPTSFTQTNGKILPIATGRLKLRYIVFEQNLPKSDLAILEFSINEVIAPALAGIEVVSSVYVSSFQYLNDKDSYISVIVRIRATGNLGAPLRAVADHVFNLTYSALERSVQNNALLEVIKENTLSLSSGLSVSSMSAVYLDSYVSALSSGSASTLNSQSEATVLWFTLSLVFVLVVGVIYSYRNNLGGFGGMIGDKRLDDESSVHNLLPRGSAQSVTDSGHTQRPTPALEARNPARSSLMPALSP